MNCKKAICVILCFVASLSSWRCFATAHTRDFDGFPGFVFWYDTVYFSPPSEVHVCKYAGTDERVVVPGEINFRWTYPTAPAIETSAKVVGIVDLSGQSYYREDNAFRGNGSVKHVVVNSPIVDIGSRVFSGCLNLMQIDLPDSLRSLGSECFSDCVSLTEITLPDNVRVISEKLFKGCKSLKMVSMPAVTNIGNYAFSDCSQLPAVELPTGIKTIGLGTFSGCSSLETISIPSSITRISSYDEYLSARGLSYAIVGAFENCAMLKHIDLSTAIGLRMIESNTFRGCTALTSIEFPNALTNIESSAFEKCGLEVVYIPDEVEEIGSRAFYDCSSLESVRLPAKLSKIGAYAFNGDYNLKKITIPASVKEIGEYAFYRPSDGIFFEGCPPVGPKTIGSAIGYYPVACKAEWQAVIDSEGYWRGLKMEMERGHFYTVKYNPNGATGGVEDQECEFGSDGILVDDGGNLHWEGHCFLGWAFAPNGEVVYKKGDYVKEPTEGDVVTLYAKWTDCVVNFNANGGVFKGRTGSAMGGVVTNQFEQYFVYGVPQKLFTDDLVPMRLDGCGNKFLGWVRGKPEITSSDDLIDAGKIWTWDDDVTEETFYAVWTTTLTVNFHHGLSPSSLDDHLKWQLIGKEGSCILKSGESIEVSPGEREIMLWVDAAYDWLVEGFDLGDRDNPNFNANQGVLTLNLSNDYTDPLRWSRPDRSTRNVSAIVELSNDAGRLCFSCKHEIRESLRSQIKTSDVPFKASKVSIAIEGTRFNASGMLEAAPAHALTGLKPGEVYALPKGIYRIKSVTYDADPKSGDPYWAAVLDANQTFEVVAAEPTDYIYINFDLFGGGDVVMVKFDPQDGTCEKTCMWYTPAYHDIGGVPHYRIYRMPPDPKKTGVLFDGWFTAATGGRKVNLMDDIICEPGEIDAPVCTTYYAHWRGHDAYAHDYNLTYKFGEDWQQGVMRIDMDASGSVAVQGMMPSGERFAATAQAEVVNEDEVYIPLLANSETGESLNFGIHIAITGEISIDDGAYWTDGDLRKSISLVSGGHALEITTSMLPSATEMVDYEVRLEGLGGAEPYSWSMTGECYLTSSEECSFVEVGEAQGWREDDGEWRYDLPFAFNFGGRVYDSVVVHDNACLYFVAGSNTDAIETNLGDLYSESADQDIFVERAADHVTFRWKRVLYSNRESDVNCSITLNADGTIRCSFGDSSYYSRQVWLSTARDGAEAEQSGDDDIVFVPNYLPLGLWLEEETGLVYGAPEQAGHYAFDVYVSDDEGTISSKRMTLDVEANPNLRPVVEDWDHVDGRLVLRGGESRTFSVSVSDPEGEALTYRWYYDGHVVQGATGPSFVLQADVDMRGWHSLICEASDGVWFVDAGTWSFAIGGEQFVTFEDGADALQVAVDNAVDGDVIYVGPGTYSSIEVPWCERVRIVATDGCANTIIDGGRTASCVSVAYAGGETNRMVRIEGFTLQDGCADMGGGARYAWLVGCFVSDNEAEYDGGGLYGGRADSCLIVGNSASYGGGAYQAILNNCTVVENCAEISGGGVIGCEDVVNTIVWRNYEDGVLDPVTTVEGDPLFVDAEKGDYRLAEGSPYIDAGDNSYVTSATDLDGKARIVKGRVDVGCYEYQGGTAELIETIVPGEKVEIDTGFDGCTVTGLPSGLKYNKSTGMITGVVTKPTASEGVVVKFTTKDFETEELTIIVTAIPKVMVVMEGVNSPSDTDGCKVTGTGAYLVGKTVTLKATAPKGVVFVGWFDGGNVVATQNSYSFTMDKKDVALVAKFKKEVMSVGCETLSLKESFPVGVLGAEGGIKLDITTESGVKFVKVDKLPAGMKYDSKTGLIIGAPTKAGDNKVVITVTANSGAVTKKEIKVSVAAMPVMSVGTFNGFVSVGEDNFGTFTLTTTDAGKLTAKVVTAAGTVSFSGTCWDAVEEGVYRATLTTKKGEKLTLTLDSTAAWDANQLSGEFTTVAVPSRTYAVSAQRNAFGKTWYFAATGDETTGWEFAYTEDTKGAALTVTLKADGSISIAGKLPNGTDTKGKAVTIKVSASGYANVGGLKDGAILADFAPVLTVNKVKTVLAITTNLWFDRKNEVGRSVGAARFVK